MQGKSHYNLTDAERNAMVKWCNGNLMMKMICFNHPGHICMGSTTDNDCVWCWVERGRKRQ